MKLLLCLKHSSTKEIAQYFQNQKKVNALHVHSIEEFISFAENYDYDAVLTDNLSLIQSTENFLNHIRYSKNECLIVFLSGSQPIQEKDIINALDNGVDKFINYPITPEILLAKLRAYLRRIRGFESATIEIGLIKVNISKHEVFVNGKPVELTKKEMNILECLALNKGKTLSKEFLLEYIYGGMDEPEIRIIDAFIWRIRKKLMEMGQEEDLIKTVWGRGYCLSG
jgi:two-component system cell cycle response regulator CtrA